MRRLNIAPMVVALIMVALTAVSSVVPLDRGALAAAGSVTGRVFQDFNSNGTYDSSVSFGAATDVGVGGITVKAYDSSGSKVGETLSGADGTYSLSVTGSASADLRVEFEIPGSGPLSSMVSSFAGPDNGTSIQFVAVGASGVDFGVNVPGEYCQNNPSLGVARLCHVGDTANLDADVRASPTLFLTDYNGGPYASGHSLVNGLTSWAANAKASESLTGSVLGLAYDKRPGVTAFYASAYVRRHTRMYESAGSPRPGAIFKMTSAGTSFLVDLEALEAGDQFSNSTAGAFGHIPSNADRKITNPQDIIHGNAVVVTDYGTAGVFEEVGAAGIGDIDMDDAGNLYVVSLYTKHLYKVPMPADGSAPSTVIDLGDVTVPVTCTNGDPRPFGLQPWRGQVYVGITCDGSGDEGASDPDANITANIVAVDPDVAGSSATAFITGIPLGAVGDVDTKGSTWSTSGRSSRWWPWLDTFTDAAFTDSVVGRAVRPVPMFSDIDFDRDGSIIMSFRDRTGDQLSPINGKDDPDGSSSNQSFSGGDIRRLCRTGAGFSAADYTFENGTTCKHNGTNAGLNVGEYYKGDGFGGWHLDTSAGFTEQVPGFTDVLMTMFDPWDDGSTYDGSTFASGGVRYNLNSTGDLNKAVNAGGGVQFYTRDGATSAGSFRKVNGMADLEAACDMAPVQIGNRVWIDSDQDGIQDPGEDPVAGATVRVYDSTGTVLLGTALTGANGEYYFSSNVSEAAAGTGDNAGGGIEAGKSYVIRLDNAADYGVGGPLEGYVLTTQNASDAATALDTSVDSNASTVASYPNIVTPVLDSGVNDHTFDVGFYDSTSTTTTSTTTSTTVAPSGSTTTTIPSSGATSTTVPGATTTTLSPAAIVVGMGNYTWIDADRDGRQDANEAPLAGVVVTLFNPDGSPATRLDGSPAVATTDAKGYYFIDNLAPGSYRAKFTLPAGYRFTTQSSSSSNSANDSNPAVDTGLTPLFDITPAASGDTVADNDSSTVASFVNPTIDAGVVPVGTVSVGNLVWRDRNGNGLQGPRDHGIAGAVLTLRTPDGRPVTDAFGRPVGPIRTGKDGKYLFKGLLPGRYVVNITYPRNYIPTTPGRAGRARNSSTRSATSRTLPVGTADLTLDFGMVFRPGPEYLPLLPATR